MTHIHETYSKNAKIVVYPGDCLELLKQIPDGQAKLIVTSPPYNLGKEYEKRLPLKDYLEEQKKILKQCVRILDDKGSLCWQVGTYVRSGEVFPLDSLFYPIIKDLGLKMRNRIIWHFNTGLTCKKRFSGRHETVMWFTKSKEYLFNLDSVRIPRISPVTKHDRGANKGKPIGSPLGKNPEDVWHIPKFMAENCGHPCQYPIALIERLILAFTNSGDLVVDPFLGSGTTAIAALLHDRKCAGAEKIPDYRQIIKERIHKIEGNSLKYRSLKDVIELNSFLTRKIEKKTKTK